MKLKNIIVAVVLLAGTWTQVVGEETGNTFQMPDFNFPKEVNTRARVVLDSALQAKDEKLAVEAFAQIALATTTIENRALNDMLRLGDSLVIGCRLKAEYASLVTLIEARMLKKLPYRYRDFDNSSKDLCMWNSNKVDSLSKQLYKQSINPPRGGIEALHRPITDFEGILTIGDEVGRRCMPELYDFVLSEYRNNVYMSKTLVSAWQKYHRNDADVTAAAFIDLYFGQKSLDDVYKKYGKKIDLGMFFYSKTPSYKLCEDYLERYPQSPYRSKAESILATYNSKWATATFVPLLTSTDSVKIRVNVVNMKQSPCHVLIYRMDADSLCQWMKHSNVSHCLSHLPLIGRHEVKFDKKGKCELQLPPLPIGYYLITPQIWEDGEEHQIEEMRYSTMMGCMLRVSDFRTFSIATKRGSRVYVVNGSEGSPLSRVPVEYMCRGNLSETQHAQTNEEGVVESAEGISSFRVSLDNDKDVAHQNAAFYYDVKLKPCIANIYTDLKIYRPGETIHASVVVYNQNEKGKQLRTSGMMQMQLLDRGGNVVETKNLLLDNFGFATTEFVVPTDRMNGFYRLTVNEVGKEETVGSLAVEVSEYKMPNFYIDLSLTEKVQKKGDHLVVKGRVLSYSGMPLANVSVEGNVEFFRLYRMKWATEPNIDDMSFEVTTDETGYFEYKCPYKWTSYYMLGFWRKSISGTYSIDVNCTDATGETQEAQTYVTKGDYCFVHLVDGNIVIEKDKPVELKLDISSSYPENEEIRFNYTLYNDQKKKVKKGEIKSANAQVDWKDLASGLYELVLKNKSIKHVDDTKQILFLYRKEDAMPPSKQLIWLPSAMQNVDEKGVAHISLGTSYDCAIYYAATDVEGEVTSGWIHCKPGINTLDIEIPQRDGKNYLNVDFFGCYRGKQEKEHLHLVAPEKKNVRLQTVSFRDKIKPGGHETWTLRLVDEAGNAVHGRLMMELYSKALEDMRSNEWVQINSGIAYNEQLNSHVQDLSHSEYFSEYKYKRPVKVVPYNLNLPSLNLYGFLKRDFGSRFVVRDNDEIEEECFVELEDDNSPALQETVVVGYGVAKKYKTGAALEGRISGLSVSSKSRVAASNDAVVMKSEAAPAQLDMATSGIKMRAGKTKVALWRPKVECAADGTFTIDFDVANENTTWCMQAMAYTQKLASDVLHTEVLAQQNIMVQPSLPRFLRTGDDVTLMANVQNASDSRVPVEVKVEVFDVQTNKVYNTQSYHLELKSMASDTVSITCHVAEDAAMVGYRITALTEEGDGDGEQQQIPVLPHVAPVVESQSYFYGINKNSEVEQHEIKLPKANETSHFTFEYCDNPSWYCLQALPTIADVEASTSTGLVHSLYAILLGGKVREKLPYNLDGVLSPLSQNKDLKIGTLSDSPWLSVEESQQRRLAALNQLLDTAYVKQQYTQLLDKLEALQQNEGGFEWIGGSTDRKPSVWATASVLEVLGELKVLECLPEEKRLEKIIASALMYMDDIVIKEAERDTMAVERMHFVSYTYMRALWGEQYGYRDEMQQKKAIAIMNQTKRLVASRWKKMQLEERPFAALLLYRTGEKKTAERMVESMSQMAIHDKQKGMYWDLTNNFYYYYVPMTSMKLEAMMLEAFAIIAPEKYASDIDEMRQWVLLNKQSNDWGGSSLAAQAVKGMLLSGKDWLHADKERSVLTDSLFKIKLKGDFTLKINQQRISGISQVSGLGYVRMDVPAGTERITLTRAADKPSWGALYHRYVAPASEIKAAQMPEISIRKEFLRKDDKGEWVVIPEGEILHVGDRIEVRLTLTNTKEMAYVTVHDERSACLEPVQHTSRWHWGYYEEIKDSSMNFFYNSLAAGAHVMTYECTVTNSGTFSSGIATSQSQYAPQYIAHSEGIKMMVEK